MNKHHQEILRAIKEETKKNPFFSKHNSGYDGHSNFKHPLRNSQLRKIAKDWIKKHPKLTVDEFLELLYSLYQGKSSDEKSITGMLLEYLPRLRRKIEPKNIDKWLNNLNGWMQVDSLCQSNFNSDDLLSNWEEWKKLIKKFNKDKNINKRRASLVLLIRPIRDSGDKQIAKLAFESIDKLKSEKGILITKAISWLLRDLIKHHRQQVESYLKLNLNALPKIAIRETKKKLLTGKK